MIYSTVVDIPAVQQLAVTGIPDGYLMQTISLETNAVIYFSTVADRHFGATIFYLYGSVHAIMRARKYIQVCNSCLLFPTSFIPTGIIFLFALSSIYFLLSLIVHSILLKIF